MILTETREFKAPERMTPGELGDHLARLVWENFSDLLSDPDGERLFRSLDLADESGVPSRRAAEESLIFMLWAHTRGIQKAFVGRGSPLLRRILQ